MNLQLDATTIQTATTQFITNVTFQQDADEPWEYVSLTVMPTEGDSTELEVNGEENLLVDMIGEVRIRSDEVEIVLDTDWDMDGRTVRRFRIKLPCGMTPWVRDAIRQVCGPRVRLTVEA